MNRKIRLFIVPLLLIFVVSLVYSQSSGAKKAFDDLDKEAKKVSTLSKKKKGKIVKSKAKIKEKNISRTIAKKSAKTEQKQNGKIVKDEKKKRLQFLNEKGKVIKTIRLKNIEKRDKGTLNRDKIEALVSANGQFVAVVSERSKTADHWYEGVSTFTYCNVNGSLLWEKNNVAITYPLSYALSFDGYRVFLVTCTIDNVYNEDKFYPAIYDEKGNVLWAFGGYREASDVYLTKNGKYGFFDYGTNDKGKWSDGTIFVDIDKKKTQIATENGYPAIGEAGDMTVSIVRGEIVINSDGNIKFYGKNGALELKKRFSNLSKNELSLFSDEEIEEIKRIIMKKENGEIIRREAIYENKF